MQGAGTTRTTNNTTTTTTPTDRQRDEEEHPPPDSESRFRGKETQIEKEKGKQGKRKKPQTCSYPRMAVLAPDTREITVLSLARSEPLAVLRDHTVPDRLELTEKK
jgi:hypothetical protein